MTKTPLLLSVISSHLTAPVLQASEKDQFPSQYLHPYVKYMGSDQFNYQHILQRDFWTYIYIYILIKEKNCEPLYLKYIY